MNDLKYSTYSVKNWRNLYCYDEELSIIFTAEKDLITNSENYTEKVIFDLKKSEECDEKLLRKPKNYEEGYDQSLYFKENYEREYDYINIIIQNQRKADVLSVFSLIEGQIQFLANLIEFEFNFNIKIKHLNGDGYIDRYWLYITKVFGIDSTEIEKEYNLIKQQKYIRNKIAHNNSIVDEKKIKFINETKGLEIKKIGSKSIFEICDKCYVMDLIANSEIFFKKLIMEIDIKSAKIKAIF